MEEKSKNSEGFIISTIYTEITEEQALNLYMLLGDWDKTSEYAEITNLGASYEYIKMAITLDISASAAELLYKTGKNDIK